MYLIRNKDGSIKKAFLNEFVNQGSNDVNFIDMAIEGREVSEWISDCFFELPNGEIAQLAGTQVEFVADDVTYQGYRIYLSDAILSYPGILKAVLRTYDDDGEILYSYPCEIMVNATTLDSTYDAPITEAQYKSFMALLATYPTSYDSHIIRRYSSLSQALVDINKLTEGQHVLVSEGSNYYSIYYKEKGDSTTLKLVPIPTNWSDIYAYTGLSKEDLSKLSLDTIKSYIDKYDVKGVASSLLTGVYTTTLTLKDLSTLATSVNFNNLYYTKEEVYSKEESEKVFISMKVLEDYLTLKVAEEKYLSIEKAKSDYLTKESAEKDYLSKESASSTYLNKDDASSTYETKVDAEKKHSSQDLEILDAKNKADSAYALASGKSKVHVFDTYNEMKTTLKNDDGTGFNLGDSLNIRATKTADYWISKKLDDNTGEFGYYEILEDESDLSEYQTIEDNTLETTHKTIVGAINENKGNIATKQDKTDNSLTTTNKTIVGGINELKSSISTLDTNKQNKTDNSLNTTSKTIVGAINEELTSINNLDTNKQSKIDNDLKTTSKTIVGAINELKEKDTSLETAINEKQSKTDISLKTTSKEVVGAVNELKTNIETNATNIKTIESKIPTKVSQLTNDSGYITKNVNDLVNYSTTANITTLLGSYAKISDVPTDNAQLTNGANYIKKDVNDLENYYLKSEVDTALNLKADKTEIPTKVSDLTNDSAFITKEVNDLTNYYTISSANSKFVDLTSSQTITGTKTFNGNNKFDGESKFIHSSYAPIWVDIANGIGKSSCFTRGAFMQLFTGQILLANANYSYTARGYNTEANKLKIQSYSASGGQPLSQTDIAVFSKDGLNVNGTLTANGKEVALKEDVSASNIISTLGTTPVNRATADADGNNIATNYVKFTDYMSDKKPGVAFAIPTTDASNLANVYIKDGVLFAKANPVPVLNIIKVDELPTVGESSTIYLVPLTTAEEENKYKEFIYIDGAWEELGTTEIDLSKYATIEWVETQVKAINSKFDDYYTSSVVDTKLSLKLDSSNFVATTIISTIGTNAVARAVADQNGNTIDTTYSTKDEVSAKVSKSGDTMTGTLVAPIIQTGSGANNYFQSQKFRGEGNAATYYHAVDFGYSGHDQVDFYEYGGTYNFWQNTSYAATTDASNRVASLQLGKLLERGNTLTYPGKSGTFALTSDINATNIINALGTNAVNRATGDKNGNDITTTYATQTALSEKMASADFTATNIVSKLGTTAVNRATSDASGNNIASTYATKTEMNSKLDATSTAIVNTLGTTAVNKATKAVQDENGNNIASTYQRSAFIVNGSISSSGTITFTSLTISELLSAINNNQRIIFVPSSTSLASIDLNALKISDNNYSLKGSFCANVSSKLTNYSCVINVTSTTASGTYTSQTANDYSYTLPTASTSTLGGIKVDGTTITITNGVAKVAQSGQQTIELLDSFPTI